MFAGSEPTTDPLTLGVLVFLTTSERAQRYLTWAKDYYKQGDHTKALKLFQLYRLLCTREEREREQRNQGKKETEKEEGRRG